jgi:hypothetical protein
MTKQGENGTNGLQGCLSYQTEYDDKTLYRNDYGKTKSQIIADIQNLGISDTSGIDLTPRIDRVSITETNGDFTLYLCKKTHVSSVDTKPNPAVEGNWNNYWDAISVQNPTYFSTLFASNAIFRFGQANQIIVVDSNSTNISAGMSGASADSDIVFWAGGSRAEYNSETGEGATWLVRRNGSGYAAKGAIQFNTDGTIVANGANFSVTSTSNDSTNWGTLAAITPIYEKGSISKMHPNVPFDNLEINDNKGNSSSTLTIGKGFQLFSDNDENTGVISFNRNINNGALYNSKYYGYQLADLKGNLILTRWNPNGTEQGGNVGIFTSSPQYPIHINALLYAKNLQTEELTLSKITIGKATLSFDSTNGVLKISGSGLVAEGDVCALNTESSEDGGGGASNLSDLLDVSVSDVDDGQVLVWDSGLSKWVNQTVSFSGGDVDFNTVASRAYVSENFVSKTEIASYYTKSEINTKLESIDNDIADIRDNYVDQDGLNSTLEYYLKSETANKTYAKLSDLINGSVTKIGTSDVGGSTKPIYLSNGVPTACGDRINATADFANKIVSSTTTIGASDLPVYLNNGEITACDTKLSVNITGGAYSAKVLETARNIKIGDGTNYGASTSFNGSADISISLPSTIKATLKGNADTATKFTSSVQLRVGDGTNYGAYVDFDGSKSISLPLPSTIKATLDGNAKTLLIGTMDYDKTDDSSSTLIIGGNMQLFANSSDYGGVISFNRKISGGKIFNPDYYGYQLANIKGNMVLTRWNPNGTEQGGHLGIFALADDNYDVKIGGSIRGGNTKLDKLTLGSASIYWDDTNSVLKIDGATLVASGDVCALGNYDGLYKESAEVKSIGIIEEDYLSTQLFFYTKEDAAIEYVRNEALRIFSASNLALHSANAVSITALGGFSLEAGDIMLKSDNFGIKTNTFEVEAPGGAVINDKSFSDVIDRINTLLDKAGLSSQKL